MSNTRSHRLGSLLAGAVTVASLTLLPLGAANAADAPATHGVARVNDSYSFSWDSVDGASAYRLEIAADPNFSQVLESVNTYSRTYDARTDLAHTDSRVIYWRVASYSSGTSPTSLGAWREGETFTVDGFAVPALNSPSADAVVNYPSPVRFAWTAVPHATSYEVQYAPNGDFAAANAVTVETTSRAYAPAAPLTNGNWSWRVRSKAFTNGDVYSNWSSPRAFTVAWRDVDSQVASPTLSPSTNEELQDLRFSWGAVPGAASYRVLVSRSSDMSNPLVNATTPTNGFVPNIPVQEGLYYWTVVASDVSGNLGVATAPTGFRVTNFAPPVVTSDHSTDVNAPTSVPADELRIEWNAVPRATLYRVEILTPSTTLSPIICRTASTSITPILNYTSNSAAGTYLKGSGSGGANCTNFTQTALNAWLAGNQLAYTVRAVNYAGNATTTLTANDPAGMVRSEASTERYVRVTARTAGTSPANNIIVQDAPYWNAQLVNGATDAPAPEMKWEPIAGADGYEVSIFRGPSTTNPVGFYRTYGTTFRPNGVFTNDLTGESYSWRVRAFTGNPSSPIYMSPVGLDGQNFLSWTRSTTASVVPEPYTQTVQGATLVKWQPQFNTAPTEGGNRGYQVDYRLAGDLNWNSEKVEYPFWYPSKISAKTVNGLVETTVGALIDGNYEFRISALDANGDTGVFSEVKQFTVANNVPQNLTVNRNGATFSLNWSPAPGAKGYQVQYRKVTGDWATLPTTNTMVGQTNYVVTLPATGDAVGEYEFQVRARGAELPSTTAVWSAWSPSAKSTLSDAAPVQQTPDAAVLPTADRTLRWAAVPGASRYMVQYATSSAAVATTAPVEVVGTSYTPEATLAPATTYYWRVTAIAEPTSSSKTLGARTVLGSSPVRTFYVVTPPKGLSISTTKALSGSEINVAWTPLTGANAGTNEGATYVVQYRQAGVTPLPAWTSTAPTVANANNITVGGLSMGVTYEFQLQAVNSEGASVWSASKTASTFALADPVTNLLVKGNTVSSLGITWSAPANTGGSPITGYVLSYAPAGQGWTTVEIGKVTSYTISGLPAGTTYNVQLTPVTAAGAGQTASAQGATMSAPTPPVTPPTTPPTTPTTPPTTPTVPTVPAPAAPTGVKLSSKAGKWTATWVAVKNAKSYTVQYSANKKTWKTLKTVNAPAVKFTSKVGKKGKYVYVRINAKNAAGTSAWSKVVRIKKK